MFSELDGSEDLVCGTVIIYSIIIMGIIMWYDRKYENEKIYKITRREKVLKNTKDEAIRESQEPLLIKKRVDDVEMG